jgi:predicted SPOUT superfamily RNA methylase MTH1
MHGPDRSCCLQKSRTDERQGGIAFRYVPYRFRPVHVRMLCSRKGRLTHHYTFIAAAPREDDGTYWGYTTRLATSIKGALDECPYEGGYDLKIGTSERGDSDMESREFSLPSYKHALIVFGGPNGIEECVDADETLKLPGSQSSKLFDLW